MPSGLNAPPWDASIFLVTVGQPAKIGDVDDVHRAAASGTREKLAAAEMPAERVADLVAGVGPDDRGGGGGRRRKACARLSGRFCGRWGLHRPRCKDWPVKRASSVKAVDLDDRQRAVPGDHEQF